jgi:phosphoribosylformylglycinamidine (FGAM) synthase-like enzyme/phosphoribosylformylglycinamidine (FGAM) synthase-like amidotransferase family enzyme
MRTAIIRYPGSNCDNDALRFFEGGYYIWHTAVYEEGMLDGVDLMVLPGGFAFGDRMYDKATNEFTISPGTKALESNVTCIIEKAYELKIPILGICNGFQILTQMGLLPGKLVLNDNRRFNCKNISCHFSFYSDNIQVDTDANMYIANSFGKYVNDKRNYGVFATYNDSNELGSLMNIAGIYNEEKTVFGMMPHPERNLENEFKYDLYKILFHRRTPDFFTEFEFHKNIETLMNSEHISYRTTKKYLKNHHYDEPWVIQGPGENAGIVRLGNGYALALRIESHNHPTYIDPFEGAATGVGGILRDVMAMGARPIALLDFLRFGTSYHAHHQLNEAISGIAHYGNTIGVPIIGGDLKFHKCYNKNPLVNVACLGIVREEDIIYGNALNEDSVLIYVGSRTGNEGIHGASMASKVFAEDTDTSEMKSNVQKSDPYLEKLLLEACVELANLQLAEGMQDMGAGGLLCASYELIARGITKTKKPLGCVINVDKVPRKHTNMDPVNVMISESQERMLIVARPENKERIFEIFEKWDLEYSVIGTVNKTETYSIHSNEGQVLYETNMFTFQDVSTYLPEKKIKQNKKKSEKNMSKSLWEIYDSTVGTRTIKGPNESGAYSIINVPESGNGRKLLVTWGESFDESMKYVNEFNAKPLAMVNCMNYADPKETMGDFAEFTKEITEKCREHHVPMVGGNVSLYNNNIKPTPILVCVSQL